MTNRLLPSKLVTSPRQLGLTSAISLALAVLAGCGSNTTTTTTPPPPPPPSAFTGEVMAGQQPIAGAAVTLYAAGTTGNGSAPTALLSASLTTDANGVFSVPAGYVCPTTNSLIYAVAQGGQTAASGEANAGISLAAVLGACGSLTTGASVTINEATTAATVYAMAQFLSADGIGATATNSNGLLLAAATAANLVNTATGTAPGASFPSTGTPPTAKINSLANLLNACVISADTSDPCTSLYSATGSASGSVTDTFTAAINIVKQPGNNVAALYTLSRASSVYSPALTAAPADWTLAVNYGGGGMNAPSAVAVDSTGKLWVANYYAVASFFTNTGVPVFANGITGDDLDNSYSGAVDTNDNFWSVNEESSSVNNGLGSISVLNNTGGLNGVYTSGGIDFPLGIAFDTCGGAWIANYGQSTVTRLNQTGTPLSGAAGYSSASLVFPVAVATDANCNAYLANQSSNTITRVLADGSAFTDFTVGNGPSGLAIDASGNIWSANYYGDSIGLVSSSGAVLSGTGYTGGGIYHPQGIAADGNGNVWVANYLGPALSELAGASATTPGAILSPPAGWAPDSGLSKAFGLAIDAGGNIWVTSFATNLLTEFVGLAVPVQTPQLGPVRIP